MKRIERFALEPAGREATSARLRLDGERTTREVEGQVLELQLEASPGFLLVTTEGTPFEEGLHVTLLDRSLTLLDACELGAPYTPGIFRLLALEEDAFTFVFAGEDRLRLRVLPRPRRAWGDLTRTHGRRSWRGALAPHWLVFETLDR